MTDGEIARVHFEEGPERVIVDGKLRLTNGTRIAVQRSDGPAPPKAQPIPVAER